jgi:AcrR family transcriptional regulator
VSTAVDTPPLLPARLDLTDARRRLFETAIVLFGDQGFHAVSVRDIAAELGLQPAALYAHVASKQQLLYELVSIGFEEHRDRLKAALLDAGRSPADQIRALVRAHVLIHVEFAPLARVANREARALSEDQLAAIAQIRRDTEQMFLDVIERGVRMGEFHVEDPYLAVLAIGGMGIRTAEWWTPDCGRSAAHVAENYATYATRLLT